MSNGGGRRVAGLFDNVVAGMVAGVVAPAVIYLGVFWLGDTYVTVSTEPDNLVASVEIAGRAISIVAKVRQSSSERFVAQVAGVSKTFTMGACLEVPPDDPAFRVTSTSIESGDRGEVIATFHAERIYWTDTENCGTDAQKADLKR